MTYPLPTNLQPYARHLIADLRTLAAMRPTLDAYADERRRRIAAAPDCAGTYQPTATEATVTETYAIIAQRARRCAAVLHAAGVLSDTVLAYL